MAKKTYVGVNNIARNVSKMYVGVNGVARKVKKAYVGVNGVARLAYENANVYISHMFASMIGQPFKIYNGSTLVLDATFPSENVPYGWRCEQTGTYTLKTSDNTCETQFTVSNLNSVTNVYWYATPYRKTFAAATDAEIKQMVESADKTGLDLYDDCAWRVGQEHTVSLPAIASSGTYDGISWSVDESHVAQNVVLVLLNKGGYQLVNAVKANDGVTNRTTCSFIYGMKSVLNNNGTNEGGYMDPQTGVAKYWEIVARRKWCNSAFRQALPENIRNVSKKFYTKYSKKDNSSLFQCEDYFTFAAAKEITGTVVSSQTPSGESGLTLFTWYNTTSNRMIDIPLSAGSSYYVQYTRSPNQTSGVYYWNGYFNDSNAVYGGYPSNPWSLRIIGVL